ncbi:zinc finger matrin-type protein 5 [Ischnura elegans]|uniref:zinc finger matrin-type protein 5 n=1 Tax=Ischnura elegans TaxID=197161 RepID=UPI001ED8AB3C|nr:zinc finger matrin-type protein 5 [Ischnura elegans]XP_046404177.1 zinc finger matrin-type protein 5 [Ischnura elegans]
MGKRYYCDYCERTFIDDIQARRKHLLGLKHTIRVKEHYASFKDPKTILTEELAKAPCHRFQRSGECPFGINCRHSHYAPEKLNQLSEEVRRIEEAKKADVLNEQSKLNDELSKDPGLPTWLLKKTCVIPSASSNVGDEDDSEDIYTGLEDSALMNVLTGCKDFQITSNLNVDAVHLPPSLRLMSADDLLRMSLDSWEDWG